MSSRWMRAGARIAAIEDGGRAATASDTVAFVRVSGCSVSRTPENFSGVVDIQDLRSFPSMRGRRAPSTVVQIP
jgi:hypothetical protein